MGIRIFLAIFWFFRGFIGWPHGRFIGWSFPTDGGGFFAVQKARSFVSREVPFCGFFWVIQFIPCSTSVTREKTFQLHLWGKNMVNFRTPLRCTSFLRSTMTLMISWHLSQVFNETLIQHEKESLVDWCFSFCDFMSFLSIPGLNKFITYSKIIFHSWGFLEGHYFSHQWFISSIPGDYCFLGWLDFQGKRKRPSFFSGPAIFLKQFHKKLCLGSLSQL